MRKVLFGSVISFGLLGASIAHAETPATTLYDANNEIIGSINSLGNIGNTSGPYENHYVFKLENTSDELIYIKLNDPNYIPGFNGYDTDYVMKNSFFTTKDYEDLITYGEVLSDISFEGAFVERGNKKQESI